MSTKSTPTSDYFRANDSSESTVSSQDRSNEFWKSNFYMVCGACSIMIVSLIGTIYFATMDLFFYGFALCVLLLVMNYYFTIKQKSVVLMKKFSRDNHFTYRSVGALSTIKGSCLELGDKCTMRHVISGKYNGYPIRFFNFGYSAESNGQQKIQAEYTCCEIVGKKQLTNMVLAFRDGGWNQYPVTKYPDKAEFISLEGDFNKHFRLFVPKGQQIEALQIFTPDIMERFIQLGKYYVIEFVDDTICIYSRITLITRDSLERMYTLAKFIITDMMHELERMR